MNSAFCSMCEYEFFEDEDENYDWVITTGCCMSCLDKLEELENESRAI